MPRIPLAQLSGAVGRPASPVLASGPSVRIDVRGLAADAEAPRINAGALGDFSGLANLAAGVGAVAGDFLAIEQKRRELDTKNRLADLENQARDAQVQFEKWKVDNPDENKWGEEYKTRFEGFRARALEQAPEWASEKMRQELDRMGSIGAAQVAGDALRQTKDRFQETWRTRYRAAEQVGDIDGMHALIDEGARDGIVWPEQTEALKGLATERGTEIQDQRARQAAAEAKRAAIDAVMNQDPRDVMAALEDERLFPELSPSDRAGVVSRLREMHRQQQSDAAATVQEMSLTGELQTAADVDALELPGLTPGMKAALKSNLTEAAIKAEEERRKLPEWQQPRLAQLLLAVEDYDGASDEDASEYVKIIYAAKDLDEKLRGLVTGPLYRKRNGGNALNYSDEVLDYARASAATMHKRGMFAQWEAPGPDGKSVVDPKKEIESQRTMFRVMRGVKNFLERNPQADESAVDNEIGRIIGQSADAETVRQMLEETMIQTLTNEPPAPPAEPLGTVNEADGLPSTGSAYDPTAPNLLFPR